MGFQHFQNSLPHEQFQEQLSLDAGYKSGCLNLIIFGQIPSLESPPRPPIPQRRHYRDQNLHAGARSRRPEISPSGD